MYIYRCIKNAWKNILLSVISELEAFCHYVLLVLFEIFIHIVLVL